MGFIGSWVEGVHVSGKWAFRGDIFVMYSCSSGLFVSTSRDKCCTEESLYLPICFVPTLLRIRHEDILAACPVNTCHS